MPPLIREQLGQGKRRKLDITSAEADEREAGDHGDAVLGEAAHEVAGEEQHVAADEEPAAAEEIGVGAADHEGDGVADGVQRGEPHAGGRVAELGGDGARNDGNGGDDEERHSIGRSEDDDL